MFSHTKQFIPTDTADQFMRILKDDVSWVRFGPSPKSRKVAHWSGETSSVAGAIIQSLVKDLGVPVCGVFLNLYEDGQDFCPFHKDLYGMDVYTLSLGASRRFLLKPDGKGTVSTRVSLESGDLYYMAEALHQNHKHAIPKNKTVHDSRISVVFFAAEKSPC